ncbi:MAG TPA: sulfite oxidase-like oxidoreductase [Candidatus Paceibacterota bacterium]|nr:sulfite oxidase-like oxidoreductase [Candidatus Paceibacterota bacterium]
MIETPATMLINKGFQRKRETDDRLPPGQYREYDFPVLSLGPTPKVGTAEWKLDVDGLVAKKLSWTWDEFNALPQENVVKDIHCVTKWSKFDTAWSGVSIDTIIELAGVDESATHLIAYSYDGYSTNLPIEDVRNGKAMVALRYDNAAIEAEHGGPARLLVPHLYFWKSAKWVNRLSFTDHDDPGFWEIRGYHNYGDPWKEQRYSFD